MKLKRLQKGTILGGLALLTLLVVAFTFWHKQADSRLPDKIAIAFQPSIAYAPLMIVMHQETLEKQFPNITFDWKVLADNSIIQNKTIANQLQVVAGDSQTFLSGWDKTINWKILASLNHTDLWLVVNNPNIKSLKDFKPEMKIGVPSLDSLQAILLHIAAKKELGNAAALDKNIIEIPHNLGFQSFKKKEIVGHFTIPPFQFKEVETGGRVILKSADILGKTTTASLFMKEDFYQKYPKFAKALYSEVSKATKLLNEQPDQAAKVLENEGRSKISRKQLKKWITNEALEYSVIPKGVLRQAELMHEFGLLDKEVKSIEELILPTLQGVGGINVSLLPILIQD
jgi:NitT/TauT family transport system substrate-binding protein